MSEELSEELSDRTGAAVTVALSGGDPVSAYTVSVAGGEPVGKAEFIESAGDERERIFFHTEVDGAFEGRGLGGLLVREALRSSRESGFTVVPVCPLFARHLARHGDAYLAEGGSVRRPRPADMERVNAAVTGQ